MQEIRVQPFRKPVDEEIEKFQRGLKRLIRFARDLQEDRDERQARYNFTKQSKELLTLFQSFNHSQIDYICRHIYATAISSESDSSGKAEIVAILCGRICGDRENGQRKNGSYFWEAMDELFRLKYTTICVQAVCPDEDEEGWLNTQDPKIESLNLMSFAGHLYRYEFYTNVEIFRIVRFLRKQFEGMDAIDMNAEQQQEERAFWLECLANIFTTSFVETFYSRTLKPQPIKRNGRSHHELA